MKIRYYKLNFIEIIFLITCLVLIFSEFLANNVNPVFSIVDDVLNIVLIACAFLKIARMKNERKMDLKEILIVVIIVLLIIIGLYGNKISGYQTNKLAIFIDILNWQKFIMAFLCLKLLINDENTIKYYNIILKISKFLIILGVILAVFNIFGVITLTPPTYDRFGISSFSLGGHPSSSSTLYAIIISFLLFERKKNKIWIFLAMLIEILTFRFKAIAFAVSVILLLFFMKKKISIFKVLLLAIAIIFIAWNQIEFYFFTSNASRAVALRTSIEIANNKFPLGSGFATFGTMMSGKYYSKAYINYNLNKRWGFSEDYYGFVGDGGWATVIATFGYIGTILYVSSLLLVFFIIKEKVKEKNREIIAYFSILLYWLICSTNESIFVSAYSILFAFVLCILIKYPKYSDQNNTIQKLDYN